MAPLIASSGWPTFSAFYGFGYVATGRELSEVKAEAATVATELAALDPVKNAGKSATVELVREYVASRSRPLLASLFPIYCSLAGSSAEGNFRSAPPWAPAAGSSSANC
jgi:hypothetical protein